MIVGADQAQIWITAIGAVVVLVPVILNYLLQRRQAAKVEVMAKSLVDDQGNPKIDKLEEATGRLATNIDGAMEELKNNIAGKNLAVGHAEGLAAGREVSIAENQNRITEKERVEDRETEKQKPV